MNDVGLRIEALSGIKIGRPRRRLKTRPRRDDDIVELRRDILWKEIQGDVIHPRWRVARMQDGFPLNKACWRSGDPGPFLQINFFPRTPVAVGIIHVATARE